MRVAPHPVFAGLERPDDRVIRGRVVRGRVAVLRVVAAADMTAVHAQPQVHPGVAHGETLLAAGGERRVNGCGHMRTRLDRHRDSPQDARCWWIIATAAAPSPMAAPTRLVEPLRTSPTANTPFRLVSSGAGA